MKTSTFIIILVLVIVTALGVFMTGDDGARPTSESAAGALLLGDVEARVNDVDTLVVRNVDGDVTLTRSDDGARWHVAELHGYEADFEAVKAAILGATTMKILEEKTSRSDRFERLGVQDIDLARTAKALRTLDAQTPDAGPIELTLSAEGDTLATLVVGNRGAGRDERYARVVGQDPSWLVKGPLSLPPDAKGWVDTALANVPATRLSSVTTVHADGEIVETSRADADTTDWTVENVPEGYELVYAGVGRTPASGVTSLAFDDLRPGGVDDLTTSDRATTTYRTFDGLVLSITTAPLPEATDGASAATSGIEAVIEASTGDEAEQGVIEEAAAINAAASGWVFTLPTWKGDAMRKRLADMATPVPEPEPAEVLEAEHEASGPDSETVPAPVESVDDGTPDLPSEDAASDDDGDGR